MADDAFDATTAAGALPALPGSPAGESETVARVANRLAAALTTALAARSGGNVTVNIAAPEPDSFRRSEAYLAGQIARAVARGQRVL